MPNFMTLFSGKSRQNPTRSTTTYSHLLKPKISGSFYAIFDEGQVKFGEPHGKIDTKLYFQILENG